VSEPLDDVIARANVIAQELFHTTIDALVDEQRARIDALFGYLRQRYAKLPHADVVRELTVSIGELAAATTMPDLPSPKAFAEMHSPDDRYRIVRTLHMTIEKLTAGLSTIALVLDRELPDLSREAMGTFDAVNTEVIARSLVTMDTRGDLLDRAREFKKSYGDKYGKDPFMN